MPTLTVQPSSTLPVPRKECLKYCIVPFEYVLDAGAYAEAYMDFDGTAYSSGQSFVFAGVTFTTSNSATSTYNTFQITASQTTSAQKFIDALNLNANFFGKVEIQTSVPTAGTMRVTVTWIEIGEQAGWDFDYSGMSPEPPHAETNGTAITLREGFKLRYQLWGENADGVFPITNVEAITPRVTGDGTVPRVCLDFKDDVKGLVATTFPDTSLNDIAKDETFAIQVFLKYGGYQVSNCEVTEFNWLTSNEATLLNSVVQIDDADKLEPYTYPTTNPVALLTARPELLRMPSTAYFWLWVYAMHTDAATLDSIRVHWEYFDSAGTSLATFTSSSTPTETGVFYFPAGPGNSPGIPAGTASIVVKLEAYHNVFEAWVDASQEYTVYVQDTECLPVEMYFQEDLGAYSTIHFNEVEEVTHNVEAQLSSLPEVCADSLYDRDLTARLQTGGFSRANIKSWKTFQASITGYDTPELERWFRQFLDSENIIWRYTSDTGDAVIRKIILEPGETVISRHDEYLTMEILFRFHTDLR